jgi:hypothetical protein
MTRPRRPGDWEQDLAAARAEEARVAELLARDGRVSDLRDHTRDFDRLDFSFSYAGGVVQVDLKEKIRPTSEGLAALWPDVPAEHIFVLDETVYRRIVWNGGGGYLIVHDHPGDRWLTFGPWELTLGPRRRYERWGRRRDEAFKKGKVMLDLRAAAAASPSLSVDALLAVIERSRAHRDAVEAVGIEGQELPEVGRSGGANPS